LKRETTNIIRYILEELLPPALHDSRFMVFLYKLKFGDLIEELAVFRKQATFLSAAEYRYIYEKHPRIQHETDNSQACITSIVKAIVPGSVCDIGCGTGYLLNQVQSQCDNVTHMTGVDFMLEDGQKNNEKIEFIEAPIERLPFPDNAFDNVICTHVLEHILDISQAIAELRRICKKQLIIVVPREREHVYTFNPHFHFFPFTHSFLRIMCPDPEAYSIRDIQRDIFYTEDQLNGKSDGIATRSV